MNRGRGRNAGGYSNPSTNRPRGGGGGGGGGGRGRGEGRSFQPHRNPLQAPGSGGGGSSISDLVGSRDRMPYNVRKKSWQKSSGDKSGQYGHKSNSVDSSQPDQSSPSVQNLCSHVERPCMGQDITVAVTSHQPDSTILKDFQSSSSTSETENQHLNRKADSGDASENIAGRNFQVQVNVSVAIDSASQEKDISFPDNSHSKGYYAPDRVPSHAHTSLVNSAPSASSGHSETASALTSFDICPSKSGTHIMLKAPLFSRNREKRNEIKRSVGGQNGILIRPGMVLLKNYFSCDDQVDIVKKCRDLGVGAGGFYQPGYRDGSKLHLKMMCLGKDWDPEKGEYGSERQIDGAKPPAIPVQFRRLVEGAIRDSQALIERDAKVKNVRDVLPSMTPNICIVNFYETNGRLGLHQDKDESRESIDKGLPVVSFSVGDSADFLYGDDRDVDSAEKVILESGDVLIFGGKSRRIFHGVTTIYPNTAPKSLLEETQLRPGRLNLTFREY